MSIATIGIMLFVAALSTKHRNAECRHTKCHGAKDQELFPD